MTFTAKYPPVRVGSKVTVRSYTDGLRTSTVALITRNSAGLKLYWLQDGGVFGRDEIVWVHRK